MFWIHVYSCFFFFNDTATTEIYTLSLHDALPISDGVSASVRAGSRIALSLAPARSFRHRSDQVASDVSAIEKLHAAGPESAGHSGFSDGQCGGDRFERLARQCRHRSRDLFRDHLHRDDFTCPQPYVWNAGRSPLVVEIYHLIFHALLVWNRDRVL